MHKVLPLIIYLFSFLFLAESNVLYADPIDGVKVENFDEVAESVYRGGAPSRADLAKLAEHGVKVVLDLREGGARLEKDIVEELGMRYINIPWEPEGWYYGRYDYHKIAAEFLEVMDNPANRPIFVHCQHGRDRAGSMIAVYRMAREGWTFRRALKEMDQYGFNHFMYYHLIKFLRIYHTGLIAAA